jgi:hypothetical protein
VILKQTGVSESGCFKLRKKARERGWRAGTSMIVQVQHVDDAKRSGRPGASPKIVSGFDTLNCHSELNNQRRVVKCPYCFRDLCHSRHYSKRGTLSQTVYRTLRKNRYHVYKRTVKPRLNKKQKEARLAWCLLYKDWTLEDWKNVIFTDETSVQKGGVRGRRRI